MSERYEIWNSVFGCVDGYWSVIYVLGDESLSKHFVKLFELNCMGKISVGEINYYGKKAHDQWINKYANMSGIAGIHSCVVHCKRAKEYFNSEERNKWTGIILKRIGISAEF
jgi:hypothetical protein